MELRSMGQADLSRASGVARQRITDYYNGRKTAGADTLFTMADALGVLPRWLVRGEGAREAAPGDQTGDDWIVLDYFDRDQLTQPGMAEPRRVPIQRQWLMAVARTTTGLWLTDMPSDAMPDVARDGDTIICRAADQPLQDGRVYLFRFDGRLIVRRAQIRPERLVLKAGARDIDPIDLSFEQAVLLEPIARVVAAINLQAV